MGTHTIPHSQQSNQRTLQKVNSTDNKNTIDQEPGTKRWQLITEKPNLFREVFNMNLILAANLNSGKVAKIEYKIENSVNVDM